MLAPPVGHGIKAEGLITIGTSEIGLTKPHGGFVRSILHELSPKVGKWPSTGLVEAFSFGGMGAAHDAWHETLPVGCSHPFVRHGALDAWYYVYPGGKHHDEKGQEANHII